MPLTISKTTLPPSPQIFRSSDDKVAKYLHEDGSETCIKTVPSVDARPDPIGGGLQAQTFDRKKFSLFASASSGCAMRCKFCYLTLDKMPFVRLESDAIKNNLLTALSLEAEQGNLAGRALKMCWMGMGDAMLSPAMVGEVTPDIIEFALHHDIATTLDGVDIATILPRRTPTDWIEHLTALERCLARWPLNPHGKQARHDPTTGTINYDGRSRLRLFHSLHSAIETTRARLMPAAMPLDQTYPALKNLEAAGVSVIFHHMFLDGVNDSESEVRALGQFMNEHFPDAELRVLRFNPHPKAPFRETLDFEGRICQLACYHPRIKVQLSWGLEVHSACGQFIYNRTEDLVSLRQTD